MSSGEHEPCVSEVSSTISRLRLHNSQSSQSQDVTHSCNGATVIEASETRHQDCELRPFSLPRSSFNSSHCQIPIIGYEVMEERARFTVYKLRIENKEYGDCWFVFRRYTDFIRLHSKLKRDFPSVTLSLPRKRWFGDNFNSSFLEERIKGLQSFINSIIDHPHIYGAQCVREFFCLDEPPSYTDAMEESRPIFDALEETIYHLRCQLREKDWQLQQLQKRLSVCMSLKNTSKLCAQCKPEVQRVLLTSDQGECTPTTSVKSSSSL